MLSLKARCWTVPREKSCGAVIFKRNGNRKYLILHYAGGHWDFVKGHMERGESEKETVRREVREEAGITDFVLVEGFRQRISYFFKRATSRVHKEVVFFLAESKALEIRISNEHVGFDWLPYDEAYERLTYENAKETLRKAHVYLENLSDTISIKRLFNLPER
jgi:8-oxo-dGTP pyrophosphatase MutT (NUDIX family)